MKIAVPMSGDCLDQHFGHCERFAFIDIDSQKKAILSITEIKAPEHQPGLLPPWLKKHDVTLVIAGGIGTRARTLCEELSIQVVAGAPSDVARVVAQSYLDGTLKTTDHVCHGH